MDNKGRVKPSAELARDHSHNSFFTEHFRLTGVPGKKAGSSSWSLAGKLSSTVPANAIRALQRRRSHDRSHATADARVAPRMSAEFVQSMCS